MENKDNLPKLTYLVSGRHGTQPREIHLALESTFRTTSVMFGQKTLGGRTRLPFIMDQSLPDAWHPVGP